MADSKKARGRIHGSKPRAKPMTSCVVLFWGGADDDASHESRHFDSAADHYGLQWVMGEVRARRRLHSGRGEGAMVAAFRVCGRHRELLMFTTFAKTMA